MKTNSKEVSLKIQKHILSFTGKRNLRNNVKFLLNTTPDTIGEYNTIKYMVDGGNFLIYHHDVKKFLNRLGINPAKKEYSNNKSWELYRHLIAREGVKLL